jgi:4-amino-4-deoxy-L-arabinose transferase-like glycosyltransferase
VVKNQLGLSDVAARELSDSRGPSRAWLAAAGVLALGVGLGATPLFDPDEPVYAQAGREMLHRGSWLVPYLDGRPWFDKPVLFYALEGLSEKLLGPGALAARLPSVLAAALLAWLVARTAHRWFGRPAGSWAAWISLTALYPAVVARGAVTDSVLILFLTMALVGFAELLGLDRPPQAGPARPAGPAAWGLAVAGLALAALTKGPVAPALLALQVGAYALVTRSWAPLRRGRVWLAGLAGVALAAPWYAYMMVRFPGSFVAGFLGQQNLTRYLSPEHAGRPVWYFAPLLPLAFLPWTLFLPLMARRATGEADDPRPRAFLWTWVAVIMVFFSLSATKLPTYILPAVPALTLLLAAGLRRPARAWRAAAWVTGAVAAAALAWAATFVAPAYVCYYSAACRAGELRQARPDERIFAYKGGLPGVLYYTGRRAETLSDPAAVRAALGSGRPAWLLLRPKHVPELAGELRGLRKLPGPAGPLGEGLLLYRTPAKADHP